MVLYEINASYRASTQLLAREGLARLIANDFAAKLPAGWTFENTIIDGSISSVSYKYSRTTAKMDNGCKIHVGTHDTYNGTTFSAYSSVKVLIETPSGVELMKISSGINFETHNLVDGSGNPYNEYTAYVKFEIRYYANSDVEEIYGLYAFIFDTLAKGYLFKLYLIDDGGYVEGNFVLKCYPGFNFMGIVGNNFIVYTPALFGNNVKRNGSTMYFDCLMTDTSQNYVGKLSGCKHFLTDLGYDSVNIDGILHLKIDSGIYLKCGTLLE